MRKPNFIKMITASSLVMFILSGCAFVDVKNVRKDPEYNKQLSELTINVSVKKDFKYAAGVRATVALTPELKAEMQIAVANNINRGHQYIVDGAERTFAEKLKAYQIITNPSAKAKLELALQTGAVTCKNYCTYELWYQVSLQDQMADNAGKVWSGEFRHYYFGDWIGRDDVMHQKVDDLVSDVVEQMAKSGLLSK